MDEDIYQKCLQATIGLGEGCGWYVLIDQGKLPLWSLEDIVLFICLSIELCNLINEEPCLNVDPEMQNMASCGGVSSLLDVPYYCSILVVVVI
jgi:hypothetical protein